MNGVGVVMCVREEEEGEKRRKGKEEEVREQ